MLGLHWRTIFSFSVYHRLAHATKWQAAWFTVYLFLLCLFALTLFTGRYVREQMPLIIKNFPALMFEKGRLPAPQTPVSFEIPQTGFSVLFDAALQTPPAKDEFIRRNLAAVVGPDAVYMPTAAGVQKQPLPEQFSFSTTQEFLNKHRDALDGAVSAMAFMASFVIIPLMFVFFFCSALTAGMFFRMLRRTDVPLGVLARWAVFLMGPLTALWIINLFAGVPLFTLAVFFLCVIYTQQIFNTFPEAD